MKILKWLDANFEKVVCVFLMSVLSADLGLQVFMRYVVHASLGWSEELARYTFIYMVAFGCGVAILKDEFVCVEFLKDFLEAKGLHKVNKVIRIACTAAMLLISVFILTQAEPTFVFIKFRMVSTAMQIPMQYIYFSQILMFLLLSISAFFRVIMFIRDWNKTGKENTMEQEIQDVIEQTGEAH